MPSVVRLTGDLSEGHGDSREILFDEFVDKPVEGHRGVWPSDMDRDDKSCTDQA